MKPSITEPDSSLQCQQHSTNARTDTQIGGRIKDKAIETREMSKTTKTLHYLIFDKDGNVSRAPRIRQTVSDTHKRPIKTSNNPQQAKHKQASKGDEPPKISSGTLSESPRTPNGKNPKLSKLNLKKNKFFRYSKCLDPLVVGPCFPLDDCCKVLSATCHRREGRLAL